MALLPTKSSQTKKEPKLGEANVGQIMPSGAAAGTKKITSDVLKNLYKTIQSGRSTFRVGGENYTVAGLASELKPIMNPTDRRRLLAGEKVKKMRPPTAGSGRMDIVFANDGALVSKKKRSASKTNNKKTRTGATKYGCGLFK